MTDDEHDAGAREGGPAAGSGPMGRYVYCIAEAADALDLGPIGIGEGGGRVYTLHHRELAAVVSDAPIEPYDPTRENLLAHELVNERVMKDHTMIPMAFGTIFRSDEDVMALLRTTATAFTDVLGTIRGKVELGLSAVWNRDRALAELEETDEAVRKLKAEITRGSGGSTYYLRMQLGRLVEGALEARARELVSGVHAALGPLAVATRSTKLIGDDMILNAAYLVERAREGDFDAAVEALDGRYRDLLTFKYTGPWPPYNFVNVKLKLERAR